MLDKCQKYRLLILIVVLLSVDVFIFYQDFKNRDKDLIFAMLDIGQGDALFIESPTGTQVLIDVGPPKKILSRLAQVMPLLDKSIDAIIITNPDQDHIGGLIDVLKVYKVGQIFEPGTYNDSKIYQSLEQEIKNKKIPNYLARSNMRLNLGGGAYIDILFPDRDVSLWERNDGSVVARLVYGEASIMLTGDATVKTEKIILSENSRDELKSTILKIGHHGSRTSSSSSFVKVVEPVYALISNGRNNKYGHPHQEVLDILDKFNINMLRTDLLGTIVFSCDRITLCEIKK